MNRGKVVVWCPHDRTLRFVRDAQRTQSLGVVDCELSRGFLALVRERLAKSVLNAQHGLDVWVFGKNRRELGLQLVEQTRAEEMRG